MQLKRLFLLKQLNILPLNILCHGKFYRHTYYCQTLQFFVYSLLQGNVEKGINFKAPTGKYTQREKEKNFYLDQSRKQDIEYPWKKALQLNLFYAFFTLTAICSISQAILRSYLLILYIALHNSHKNMFRLCLASDQCFFLTLCIEAFLSLTSLSKSNER